MRISDEETFGDLTECFANFGYDYDVAISLISSDSEISLNVGRTKTLTKVSFLTVCSLNLFIADSL